MPPLILVFKSRRQVDLCGEANLVYISKFQGSQGYIDHLKKQTKNTRTCEMPEARCQAQCFGLGQLVVL